MHRFWWLLLLILMLFGCGLTSNSEADKQTSGGTATSPLPSPSLVPPALQGGLKTRRLKPQELPANIHTDAGTVIDPSQIVFTDMDSDAEEISRELKELFESAPQEGPWRKSYTNTFRDARLSGKPVLIWFSDSKNSPNDKALSEELFRRKDFEEWASQKLIRLELDQNVQGNRTNDDVSRKIDYIKNLKTKYKILGQPTILVLTPEGKVIGRYKGYKRGTFEFKWAQIRQATKLAEDDYARWIAEMESKGYRVWSNPAGKQILAKLVAYRKGELILVEPDGTRSRTKETHLSKADRNWISAEKEKRGMH